MTTAENIVHQLTISLSDRPPYTYTSASRAVYPVAWYLYTGRASLDFERTLWEYVRDGRRRKGILLILEKGGSDSAVISAIRRHIRISEPTF